MFEFTAYMRGYHYYRKLWSPQPNQHLQRFNRFFIKVCEINQENTTCHLPKGISRATKFLIDGSANVRI